MTIQSAQERLREDLEEAYRARDYFQGLTPFIGANDQETEDVAGHRKMALEDVQSRIKELEEELADELGREGTGGS